MLLEEYETEASMLHDSQILDSSEVDVDPGATAANTMETEPGEAFEELARPKPATKFYTTQLDRMYEAEIKCFGKDPAKIIEELEQKAEEIKMEPEFQEQKATKALLDAIKVDEVIEPDLFASEVTKEIDATDEFRNLDQLKDFLYAKKQEMLKRHVQAVKNSDQYQSLHHELDIDATIGKQLEITCDYTGQIYLISQFHNEHGANLAIYTFDIETGEIGEAILSEQLITTVQEGEEEEEEAAQPKVTRRKSTVESGDEMERAPDDEAEEDEEQKTPEKKEEKEETTTEASPAKSLMQQLSKPKEVIHDFNCFNRIWTKRYESIYFYKVKNNYQKEEQNLELMRFNLHQRTLQCVRTPTLKKLELKVESNISKEVEMKTPFGINCVCFQEHSADNILQRDGFMQEPMFLARQMVLVIFNDYKTASLRSVNEMMVNIVCYENKTPVTWSLYRHEKLNGSSFSPIEIGGMTKLKAYKPLLTGNLFRPNNRSWQFSKIDDTQQDLLANLAPRYKDVNSLIYTKQISKAGNVHFSRQKMKDENNVIKQSFLNLYEIDVFEGFKDENIYQQLVYMKSSFQFDTFMILQNYLSSTTYLFMSQVQSKKLRVYQLKSHANQVVLKPWHVDTIHPITKMQYKHQEDGANLVQVHPLFADIVSNGEKLLSYAESSYKLGRQLRFQYKPMYLDEFLDDNEQNKYMKEYPSAIFQMANDDRQYVPRLGIDESKNDDTLIYIDIHNAQSQKEIFDNECQKQIKHDITATPSKRKLFINAWHYGWKELEVSSRFFTTSFQPSSSIELVDREKHLFKQNWQVCCLDYSQLVIYIYEYCLTWSDLPLHEDSKKDDYNLMYIGKTLVLLQQPWKVYKRVNFLPYYPNNDNQLIGGTQLVPEFQSTTKIHFIFENQKANDIQFKTDLCSCSYKIFQNSSRQIIGFTIKTRMCDRLLETYTDTQKNMIFDLQQRVIANMALNRDVDIDQFVAKILSDSKVEDKQIVEAHYKPQEILNGQSILDFLSSSPNLHSKMHTINNPNSFKLTILGMLYDSFDPAKKKKHIESIKETLPANFIADDNQIAVNDDLFFNNIITRCFDDLKRRSKACKELIKYELKKPESLWIHCRMMQILPIIIKSKMGFEDFQDFFIDYDGRDEMTTFAIKLKHTQLPDFGPKNQILRKLHEPRNSNANNQKMIINTLIDENEANKLENSVPVQHFVIDFRGMLLANQIRHELKDSKVPEITNFTKYDMHYIVYRIARKYGNKIEQFDTLRAIIDYQFLHRTKKIFQVRFANFGFFFLIPFLIQLFSAGQTLGYLMNFCCVTQVIATLWHIRQYYIVEGMRKLSRKTSSIIDFALAVSYMAYLVMRVNHNAWRSTNRSTLPDAANATDPSVNLAFSILLNLAISVLVSYKVMLALKVDEEYGLLWQLVAKCLWEMWPFSVFLVIWLLFFAVLYKILGSQASAASQYEGITAALGYFFYNFQIAVNNASTPTFSIWTAVGVREAGQPWYFEKVLAKTMIYLIYAVWFLQQILIPVIFMNFIIAFISGTYMTAKEKKIVLLEQQKAELTRECLITTKSLGREKRIDCLVLSANTFDESLGTHWYKFVQSTKKILRATIDKMKVTLDTAQSDSDAYIEKVKQDVRKQMTFNHEQLIKQVQNLSENANKMN